MHLLITTCGSSQATSLEKGLHTGRLRGIQLWMTLAILFAVEAKETSAARDLDCESGLVIELSRDNVSRLFFSSMLLRRTRSIRGTGSRFRGCRD